jgi:hypothetical protein
MEADDEEIMAIRLSNAEQTQRKSRQTEGSPDEDLRIKNRAGSDANHAAGLHENRYKQ